MQKLDEMFGDAIEKAIKERGHINILIAGRSGVGKSTLINSVFEQNLAETGQGRPVTKTTREIRKEGVPISIFDTRGLEMSDFKSTLTELENLIRDRCGEVDKNRHIHAAWLCIHEDGRRVEDAEIKLHEMLSRHVPLITVITKAKSDNGFRAEVQKLLPESRNVLRVRAISETMDDGHLIPSYGLPELVEMTSEVIPEGNRRALAAAQKASIDYKKNQAHKIVAGAASAAAIAGASPIPFSDAAILAPIQVGMIAAITSAFGMEMSRASLSALVASAVGVGGATFVGRTVVVNVIKMFPGAGSVVGGAISATTATAITIALGEAYIKTLAEVISANPDKQPDFAEVADLLKSRMGKAA